MTHTKDCLANAMIQAVENLRDSREISQEDFTNALMYDALPYALGYLSDGLLECRCDDAASVAS